jgi:cell division protein FtsB
VTMLPMQAAALSQFVYHDPMRLVAALLLLLLLVLQARLWLGDTGIPELWRLHIEVDAQVKENQRLGQRNDTLEAEVMDLKEGTAAVEERARSELGMIKSDEQLIFLADPGDKTKEGETP